MSGSEVTAVARACIRRTWEDGSVTAMEVEIPDNYPDAPHEAVARVKDLWREVCIDEDAE